MRCPCRSGYFYTRQYHYCIRYAGYSFTKESSFNACYSRNETLIKVNSGEENLFVSSLIYSFVNKTLNIASDIKSHQLIIDGEKASDGHWRSLFGTHEILNYTKFEDGYTASTGRRIYMSPTTFLDLKEYIWKAGSLNTYKKSVFCQYQP
ncbi:uncharacterized protein LOC134260977 [Saccostrea cucullata]|uniref:uncharacterized protein LOC134260977 n=1 Tax=Saccostrea cuccullata TaxID=36930 RepID=UPI002ED323B0